MEKSNTVSPSRQNSLISTIAEFAEILRSVDLMWKKSSINALDLRESTSAARSYKDGM